MATLARREDVKASGLEVNLWGIGFADFLPGAQQFVSDFKRRAREVERTPVYIWDAVRFAKSLLIRKRALASQIRQLAILIVLPVDLISRLM
jgi:hypothetical protein